MIKSILENIFMKWRILNEISLSYLIGRKVVNLDK